MQQKSIPFTKELTYKAIWEMAYKQKELILDFSHKSNPTYLTYKMFFELSNYKRWVRKNRLNPLLAEEWRRLNKTSLSRIRPTSTKLYLAKAGERFMKIRFKFEFNRHPLNKLHLPTSTKRYSDVNI